MIDPVGFYYFSVTPGTYYVYEVNQTGWTQTAPSTVYYGPLVVSATTPTYLNQNFGNQLTGGHAAVSGYKWHDLDADGVWDDPDGIPHSGDTGEEPPLSGWVITATATGKTTQTATTDATGFYSFSQGNTPQNGLEVTAPSTTWTLTETLQSGWTQSFPASPGTHVLVLRIDQNVSEKNFGNYQKATKAGFKY